MDQNAKQQAVEQIKQANNVLVTVSANPSVDQLSAALGLTLMLTKMGKHSTAVVSGAIPPAISFLDPNKTFTNNVDGLRDFIIALDKDKADKLRYKVENNVVRIFITPYDGEISERDLQFSQGDFNVDVVVALGVANREDIDNAIKAHGRILHDASVVTINTASQKTNLGSIDWQDPSASSLSEMMVSVSEAFQGGLLDSQISTALLTGIDAATDRFSNEKTSPKIMTMAAQLMAAGANQQLIANNLTPAVQAAQPASEAAAPPKQIQAANAQPPAADGELKLEHDQPSTPPPVEVAPPPVQEVAPAPEIEQPAPVEPPAMPAPSPVAPPPIAAPPVVEPPAEQSPMLPPAPDLAPPPLPSMPAPESAIPAPSPIMPPAPAPEPAFPEIKQMHQKSAVKPPTTPVAPPSVGQQPGGKTLQDIEKEVANLASSPGGGNNDSPTGPQLPEPQEHAQIQKNSQPRLPDPAPVTQPEPTMQDIEDGRNVAGSIVGESSPAPQIGKAKGHGPVDSNSKPALGGTFNATADDARDESERERQKDVNKAILDHDKPADSAAEQTASGGPAIDVDAARKAVEQAVEQQPFDPANHPIQSLNAAPMAQPEAPTSTEINIDPNGNIVPAAAPPAQPDASQTLALPGVPATAPAPAPQPSGMPPLATDSLDASPPPPLPNPPGPLPPQQ